MNALFGLLAVFPVLALPILVGGVTGAEFVRLLLAFATIAFFSLSIGLFASVVNREAKDALTAAIGAMFVFSVLMPALWWLIALGTQRGTMGIPGDNAFNFLLWPCPVYAYLKAFAYPYAVRNGPTGYWNSLWTMVGISFVCLVAATSLLPRVWHSATTPLLALRSRLRFLFPTRANAQRRVDGANPIYSFCMHDARTRRHVRTVLIILVPIWFLFLLLSVTRKTGNEPLFCGAFFTAYAAHFAIKMLIALEGSRRLSEDRQSGALELILVTPIQVKEILKGQLAALKRQFRGVLVLLCAMNASMMFCVVYFSKALHTNHNQDLWAFGTIFFGGMIALLFDFPGLAWLSMWRAIKSRKHHNAVIVSLLQIVAPGWLAVFFLAICEPRMGNGGPAPYFATWFAICAVISAATAVSARKNVSQQFRSIAVGRF